MDFWNPNDFAALTNGRWLVPPGDPRASIAGVGIDSRTFQPGQAFFAVKGETHDGHDHVAVAIDKGAAIVVVSDEQKISDLGFRISGLQPTATDKSDASPNPKSEIRNPKSLPILLVPDTVLALQQLARVWRDILKQRSVKVVAVTGSSGKTTTRNLIHTALSAALRGTQSPKSFNNHLGVPLTLLAAPASDDFVVAEVGTNHHGEIAHLASILRPDIAVITNIGHAHIGHFGSQDAIAQEKSSLLKFLQPGGVAVVNGSQPWSAGWQALLPSGTRMIAFRTCRDDRMDDPGSGPLSLAGGRERVGVRADQPTASGSMVSAQQPAARVCQLIETTGDILMDAGGLHFTVLADHHEPLHVDLPMLGAHNAENALVAVAVARELGVPSEAMAAALAKAKGVEMRMELMRLGGALTADTNMDSQGNPALTPALSRPPARERGPESTSAATCTISSAGFTDAGITVINDAYNANPDSMAAAIATLVSLPASRRVAILADMLELGEAAATEHAKIGRLLLEHAGHTQRVGLIVLIGEAMGHAAGELLPSAPAAQVVYVPRFGDDLPARVAGMLHSGDVVLLKGSRGLRLERLLPAMKSRFSEAAAETAQTGK